MRLVDMDRDGLYVSVIYGPAVLGLPIADDEFKAACWRAWNDFAIEFNSYDPDAPLRCCPCCPRILPRRRPPNCSASRRSAIAAR